MYSITTLLAQVAVPDSGTTGILLGIALVTVGLVARYLTNRKR